MNTFITPTWVTKDVALNFDNELTLVDQFDRSYSDEFKNKPEGAQIGYTVQARIQQRFTVSEGQALQQQAILNQTVPITLNHQYHVDMGWSSAQATLEVEEVQDRYTVPAGMALANKTDLIAGREVYQSVYLAIGSPGVQITTNESYLDAVALLENQGVPGPYCAVLDPKSRASIINANLALFNLPGGDKIMRKGRFSTEALGISEWYSDPNIPMHTTGTFTTATPIVSGASQTGSTLAASGLGTYAFKSGDEFTIAGVNSVNPVSYADTGDLQQFSVQADLSGTTTGTLSISPAIITSGPLMTVTASPANGAALTFNGATGTVSATMAAQKSRQSFLMNGAAFAFVMADLVENLAGANSKRISSKSLKMSMRWAEQWNIQTDQSPSRVDIIIGVAPVLPYFAARLWS